MNIQNEESCCEADDNKNYQPVKNDLNTCETYRQKSPQNYSYENNDVMRLVPLNAQTSSNNSFDEQNLDASISSENESFINNELETGKTIIIFHYYFSH